MGWFIVAVFVAFAGFLAAIVVVNRRKNARRRAQFAALGAVHGLTLECAGSVFGALLPRVSGSYRGHPCAVSTVIRQGHPVTLLYLQCANPAGLDGVVMTKACSRWATLVNLVNQLAKRPQDARLTPFGDVQLDDALTLFTNTPTLLPRLTHGPLRQQLVQLGQEQRPMLIAMHGPWLYACYDAALETDLQQQHVEQLLAWLAATAASVDRLS